MAFDENVMIAFQIQEFQDTNERLQEIFSELLEMPPVIELKINKNKTKLENFETLEKEFEEVKTAYSASCENFQRMQKDLEKLQMEAEEKTTYYRAKLREKTNLENELALLSKSKICHQDLELLESTKLRYKALRNMTQVKFSFEKYDKDKIEGFAFNSVNKKVKYFSISNYSTLTKDQISERIIACMEEVSGTNVDNICME